MIDTRVRDEVVARQRMKWACKRCPHTAIHWETVLKVQHRPGDNSKCWALMALRNSEGRLWDLHLEVMILLCTQTIQTGKERRIMSELASLCHYSSSKLRAQEYGPPYLTGTALGRWLSGISGHTSEEAGCTMESTCQLDCLIWLLSWESSLGKDRDLIWLTVGIG